MGKMLVSAVLATLVFASALAMSGTVAAEDRPLQAPERVVHGETDRYGGGNWIAAKAGDTLFGVVYGTDERPNSIVIFAEYKRFLGGAEIYDSEGNFLRRMGIPVWTVFSQRLDFMVEFKNVDRTGKFDFRDIEGVHDRVNVPIKALSLVDAWNLSAYSQERTDTGLHISFDLSLHDKPYKWVWDETEHMRREATPEDGVVEEITFSFKLNITKERVSIENVPWYEVTVADGREREVVESEFLEYRTFEGVATSMGVKYDHYFQGWDFVGDMSHLALETKVVMGHSTTRPVAQWLHMQFGEDEARDRQGDDERGEYRHNETDTPQEEPVLIEKDSIYFDDDWYRVGRLRWASEVEVDGEVMRMAFQVHGAKAISFDNENRLFRGLALRGAYIYPAAEESIYHDPEFVSTALDIGIPSAYNLVPGLAVLAQVAVIVLAILAAVLLAVLRRLRK